MDDPRSTCFQLDHTKKDETYGAEGFLYWAASRWLRTDDLWIDIATVKDLSLDVYGDGSLLYNGNKMGIDGALASIRPR